MKTANILLKRLIVPLCALGLVLLVWGCKVSYTFSGASIDPKIQTVSVSYFPNMAAMVSTILSPTLTDALTTKLSRETRLQVVREEGDISFEGEITDYRSSPMSISGDEYAVQNRLTIVVKVRFTNNVQPEYSFDRTFTAYEDYDTNRLLTTIEGEIIPQIVEKLVDDIFNAALSNW